MKFHILIPGLIMAAAFSGAAHAEKFDSNVAYATARGAQAQKPGSDSDWTVTLGGGGLVTPEYEGGDEYEFKALPYFDVRYKDIVDLGVRGLNVNVVRQENFKAGVGLGVNFGRDEDDADHLRGLGDVDASVEGQAFAEYSHGKASTRLTFSHDLGDGHEGYTVQAEAGYVFVMPEHRLSIRPSVSTIYASDEYTQSFFGVNSAQSARSGLRRYDGDAGFKDVSAGAFMRYSLDENWSVNGLVQYSHLLGDASDSPVTEEDAQITGGAFIAYTF